MTTADPARPRHARAEIRNFAKELRNGGWTYERNDAKGHTLWSHPKASGLYKLAETPSHFSVQRARRDVARLLGQKPATGKRKGKAIASAPRRDFALEQAQKAAQARTTQAPVRQSPREMSWPAICRHCKHLHDSARVEVVQRYTDCSVWRCPGCRVLIDDRPHSLGGSLVGPAAIDRLKTPPPRRTPRRLPWEDQADGYDRGLDRLMREVPGGR